MYLSETFVLVKVDILTSLARLILIKRCKLCKVTSVPAWRDSMTTIAVFSFYKPNPYREIADE